MAKEKKTAKQALQIAARLIRDASVRGIKPNSLAALEREEFTTFMIADYERSFSVGASISIRAGYMSARSWEGPYTLEIDINWSGTGRDTSTARAAVVLYSELVDLACEIEAVISRYELTGDDS